VGVVKRRRIKANDLPPTEDRVGGRSAISSSRDARRLRSIQVTSSARRSVRHLHVSSLSTLVNRGVRRGGLRARVDAQHPVEARQQGRRRSDLYDLILSGDNRRGSSPGRCVSTSRPSGSSSRHGSVNRALCIRAQAEQALFDLPLGGASPPPAAAEGDVERIESHKVRTVEEFPLDMSGLSRPIRDGDLVTVVYAVPPSTTRSPCGGTSRSGRFPWREACACATLSGSRSLLSREYWLKRNQAVAWTTASRPYSAAERDRHAATIED